MITKSKPVEDEIKCNSVKMNIILYIIANLCQLLVYAAVNSGGGGEPFAPPAECDNETARYITEQDVANDIFELYGSWQLPRRDKSTPISVNITLVLSSIEDVIERQSLIKLSGYLRIVSVRNATNFHMFISFAFRPGKSWFDAFRHWKNKFPYNCIDYVVTKADRLWIPDLAQINAEERYALVMVQHERARVHSNGFTSYSPGGTFSAFCTFDLTL